MSQNLLSMTVIRCIVFVQKFKKVLSVLVCGSANHFSRFKSGSSSSKIGV